jgi:4-hydroxybenzoyl-CoA reductase subunit beta
VLRMPEFEVHLPRTAAEAVLLRSSLPEAMYVAGGTDLLPNLKHHLHAPKHLVSLSHVEELAGIELLADGTLRIGAGTKLQTIADDEIVRREANAVAVAAGSVAGPQHRRMGTIGGNVMLDTRCLFYNQTKPWREALGYCLKKDGTWCHVIGSDRTCVAAQSSDTVPALIALGASLEIETPDGLRTVSLDPIFHQDGRYEKVHQVPAESLVRAALIPPRKPGQRSTYRKVRHRNAVDFPQLGVGLAAAFDGATCTDLQVVVGAVMPKPRLLKGMEAAIGSTLDDATIARVAEKAHDQVRPQRNIHGDPAWRRHMVRIEVRRGLEELRARG